MKRTINQMIRRFALTTGEVALLLQICDGSVKHLTDRKKKPLPSYRVGAQQTDRRIPRDKLIKWMLANGMPLNQLEDPACPRILFVCRGPELPPEFKEADVSVQMAGNVFDAGVECQAFLPACVVIDADVCSDPHLVCRALRRYPTQPIIFAIGNGAAALDGIADFIMNKPFTEADLKARILQAVSGRYARRR